MSTFEVTIEVGDLEGHTSEQVSAPVDTGATATVIPTYLLRQIGVAPTTSRTFEYANGEEVDLDMGQARVTVEGRETFTWVIFGDDGAGSLLGALTLESLFLGVDPFNERLIPVKGILK